MGAADQLSMLYCWVCLQCIFGFGRRSGLSVVCAVFKHRFPLTTRLARVVLGPVGATVVFDQSVADG